MLRAKQIPSASSRSGRNLRFEALERRQMFAVGGGVTPPVITAFRAVNRMNYEWIFTGKVVDASAPVAGMIVQLGGVLAPYHISARVQKDGTFQVEEELR